MKPSRELDSLVAKHVMGYECVCDEEPADCPIHAYNDRDTLRAYSIDIAAAFAVDKPGWLWKFQETSQTLTVTLYTSPEMLQESIRDYPILPEGVVLIRREWLGDKAQTYAWLRCLAALEAVGIIYVPEGESITLGNRAMLRNVTVAGVEVEDA